MQHERFDHPLASQRVNGKATLGVRRVAGRSRIETLQQMGAAKIRVPASCGDGLEAILINTAGGMTGGDRLNWTISVARGASATVTTQACEKAYRTISGSALIATRLDVGNGAHLAWLPQETIVYDGSALSRQLEVDIAQGATALICEATIFGRKAMGEFVRNAQFRDHWRIRAEGRLIHAENLDIDGEIAALLDRKAVANGNAAIATVLLVAPEAETLLDAARKIIGENGGASGWRVGATGKLLARMIANDGYSLRQRLVPLLELLNGRAALPKVWSL